MRAPSILAALTWLAWLAAPAAAQDGPAFQLGACPEPLAGHARCGTLRVAEDRRRPGGRLIDLNLVILPSIGPARHPALFDLEGGPGLPSTKNAGFYLTEGAAYRVGRDIVLFDQRGTGASHPLHCPALADPALHYQPAYPSVLVEACRAPLAAGADLRKYGTDAAAADIDAVRQALGYDRIDLTALSYGTTAAFRYLALYPGRTRAAVLFGIVPPGATPPRHHAPVATAALHDLFEACAAEPPCRAAFPEPGEDLRRALARLSSIAGAPAPEVFMEALRKLLYMPASARAVPLILNRAAAGDLAPFYERTRPRGPNVLAEGTYLSITCSESLALMDYEATAAASRATPFGDYRLRRQRRACRNWPTYAVAPRFTDAPAPNAALLLISGALDPVTPPAWAERVARAAPHARHIVLPGGGHGPEGVGGLDTCLDPLIVAFLAHPDPAAIDTNCVAQMTPPPFLTALPD